jgi:hypothetical protein
VIGTSEPVLQRYVRLTFEKEKISLPGKPVAAFVCPGHQLLDATIGLLLERYRDLLKRGAVLVDQSDPSDRPRALLHLEHAIQDARGDPLGNRRTVSKQLQFVGASGDGTIRTAGSAPYLDYRPLTNDEEPLV